MDENAMVIVTVDGIDVSVSEGTTIRDACRKAGIVVPSLCHLEGISHNASCGICVVEVKGVDNLVRSCSRPVSPGMSVITNSSRVLKARKMIVELLLANHPEDCLLCIRNTNCELQSLAETMGIQKRRFARTKKLAQLDSAGWSVLRDPNKCILCGRCVDICRDQQTVSAIDFVYRGAKTAVAPFMNKPLSKSVCVSCGQCTLVCPTGALTERDETDEVLGFLNDPEYIVIAQTAPSIRVSLGEALGLEPGSVVTGKMIGALRRLGFDRVFDTQFAADLAIMEEAEEFITRLKDRKSQDVASSSEPRAFAAPGAAKLPLLTSCSPGWISFIETFYPELLPHLSTCKSPQQMFGAIAKTYWAQKEGIDSSRLIVVSIMPCTAKKFEAKRPEMRDAWEWHKERGEKAKPFYDVDYVLTTREFARMIKRAGINFDSIQEEAFDSMLGESSGAAALFASSGGVAQAVLRTVNAKLDGPPENIPAYRDIGAENGIKSAELSVNGEQLNIAVVHTLKNARLILDGIVQGENPYDLVEIMTCPGGCIGGGGQPVLPSAETTQERVNLVRGEDRRNPIRRADENIEVQNLYHEFLGYPESGLSMQLLHTRYLKRKDKAHSKPL